MNHSKEQDYLITIKKNHKVSTHIENKKGEHFSDSIFRHLRALKNVYRLSSIKTLQSYSVAEHCYYTGLLFELVARHERIVITREELYKPPPDCIEIGNINKPFELDFIQKLIEKLGVDVASYE